MDRDQFDRLARLVWTRQSRRTALATIFGASLVSANGGAAKRGRGARRVAAQAADRCYPGKSCTPGKGKNTSRCDFAFSTVFRNKDVRGANLSRGSFAGADLRGADFRGANLSGGCFASADLTGAKLGASVNLHEAVFCNTTMPDGTIDNSGCEGETPCCHLRVQNCPDAKIECYTEGNDGCSQLHVGAFGPVGNSGSSSAGAARATTPTPPIGTISATRPSPERATSAGTARARASRCKTTRSLAASTSRIANPRPSQLPRTGWLARAHATGGRRAAAPDV